MTSSALKLRPLLRPGPGAAAMICLCLAQAALAEETRIYQWRDANGVVSYAQHPPPAGTRGVTSRVVDVRSLTPAQQAAVRANLAGDDAAGLAAARSFRDKVDAADLKVNLALQQLARAEQAMRDGREPLAGERVGNARGGSRLRADYFDRQQQLEDAVKDARAKLDEAYRVRASITP
ncbi:MAG TPA: DUF4124 domain-containing protein [Burkholderiaceae bacterium]